MVDCVTWATTAVIEELTAATTLFSVGVSQENRLKAYATPDKVSAIKIVTLLLITLSPRAHGRLTCARNRFMRGKHEAHAVLTQAMPGPCQQHLKATPSSLEVGVLHPRG